MPQPTYDSGSTSHELSTPGDGAGSGQVSSTKAFWVLVVVGLGVMAALSWPRPAPKGWWTDPAAAAREAKQSGKPMLIAFHNPGCPPCGVMEGTTLRDERVTAALADFVAVRVHANDELALAEQLRVRATPTYWIVSPDAVPLAYAEGVLEPDEFVQFLQRAEQPTAAEPESGKRGQAPSSPEKGG